MTEPTPRFAYGLAEAAKLLSLSVWTLRKWGKTGKLRVTRLGSRVVVEHSECMRLLAGGRKA